MFFCCFASVAFALFNTGYLILPDDALRFISGVWLWYPEGVRIGVWGEREGSTAHSCRQTKTDRSNKKRCAASYQSLKQHPHIHPVFSSRCPSLYAFISLSLQVCFLILFFLFNTFPSLTATSYYLCHLCTPVFSSSSWLYKQIRIGFSELAQCLHTL